MLSVRCLRTHGYSPVTCCCAASEADGGGPVVPAASATMGMGDVKFLEGDVANIIVSIIHKNLKPEDVRADGLCCGGRGEGKVELVTLSWKREGWGCVWVRLCVSVLYVMESLHPTPSPA